MNKVNVREIVGIDKECIDLCEAINKLQGIYTVESCCGHGRTPYHIFFKVESLEALPPLLYHIDCGHRWKVVALTDATMCPVYFLLEGPIGREAYFGAHTIATRIEKYVKWKSIK